VIERTRMLTPEQNERVTRIGPGTPMGTCFRRYWIPGGPFVGAAGSRRPADSRAGSSEKT